MEDSAVVRHSCETAPLVVSRYTDERSDERSVVDERLARLLVGVDEPASDPDDPGVVRDRRTLDTGDLADRRIFEVADVGRQDHCGLVAGLLGLLEPWGVPGPVDAERGVHTLGVVCVVAQQRVEVRPAGGYRAGAHFGGAQVGVGGLAVDRPGVVVADKFEVLELLAVDDGVSGRNGGGGVALARYQSDTDEQHAQGNHKGRPDAG